MRAEAPPTAPVRALAVWQVALADFLHDWRLSLVAVLGVTVALAPLVILFGLKLGVVDRLRADLLSDPRNLELILPGGGAARFDEAWFAETAALPETGFLTPMTRGTVARILLRNRADREAEPADVALIPTGAGDPVLERAGVAPPTEDALVLSASVAAQLRVAPGAAIEATITRTDGTRREGEFLDLTVAAVLPPEADARSRIYAPLALVVAVEDYREWQRVEAYGWPGRDPVDDPFADFRLYAADLDAVAPLKAHLEAQGLTIESAAASIARVRRIDGDLSLMFAAILALSVAGFATTLALNQLATVARKRTTLAVLRLLGYGGVALMAFPIVQGALIGLLGALAALAVFAAMDPVIGALFADLSTSRTSLTRLPAEYALAAPLASTLIAALASAVAAAQVLKISPSTELRHA
ncbi:MAG: FtsX-like permease family protein [Pseudomonadota bacterium]